MIDQQYLKQRLAKIVSEKDTHSDVTLESQSIVDLYQDSIADKYKDANIDLDAIKKQAYKDLENISPKDHHTYINNSKNYIFGTKAMPFVAAKVLKAQANEERVYIIEDTFIRSIVTLAQKLTVSNDMYLSSCGYTVDDLSHYVDATRASRMEIMINSDLEITKEQKIRARKAIDKIINNKITKYNNQPIAEPKIGRDGVKKILVIDQSYNDASISKGMANDQTFKDMLNAAINDNPDADVIIKTHPDAVGDLSLKQKCYYQNTESKGNVYKLTDMVNPISLINYIDKVYVCSSQFGFEALMCGKETHIFGMPFYAGWGLTIDVQKLDRRTKQRTLEEVFYISYIMCSMYFNPKTNKPCEIEEAIDFLVETRNQYFKENKND